MKYNPFDCVNIQKYYLCTITEGSNSGKDTMKSYNFSNVPGCSLFKWQINPQKIIKENLESGKKGN